MKSDRRRNLKAVFVNGLQIHFMSGVIRQFGIQAKKTAYAMYFTLTKWWLSSGIFFILLTSYFPGNAQQVLQTNRYELSLEKNDFYEVMPSQEDGMFIYRRLYAQDDDKIEI